MEDGHRKMNRPRLGLAVGDPAGIGPELAVKLVADSTLCAATDIIVVGDGRILEREARILGLKLDLAEWHGSDAPGGAFGRFLLNVDAGDLAAIQPGIASPAGGRSALANFEACLDLAVSGRVDGVCFTPFNKTAMRLAQSDYVDEIHHAVRALGVARGTGAREFNVLDGLWNARITSHVPLSAVPSLVSPEAVLEGIRQTDAAMREAGFDMPRIAVAALNPHAGDGGAFGHEDDTIIAPAVAEARELGMAADGPFPSDSVFLRATKGDFDAVVTMYHDQGQIAMKVLGFDRGVTLLAGFPFPICTPAHGSAYDIAGKGAADPGASRAAVLLAERLARACKAKQ